MTPQEKAVIEAAVRWFRTETVGQAEDASEALHDLVVDLLASRMCTCSRTERVYCHAENCRGGTSVPEWLPATFAQCLAGDRIRLGAEETDVLSSSTGTWHVGKEASRHPVSWEHAELRMDLAANPGVQQYPPNAACEILCTPERKAFLLMQQTFPGSAVVSSDVD